MTKNCSLVVMALSGLVVTDGFVAPALAGAETSPDDGAIIMSGRYRTVAPSSLRNAIAIVATSNRSGAVRDDGHFAMWGSSQSGQSWPPTIWPPSSPLPRPVVQIECGSYYYWIALLDDGSIMGEGAVWNGTPIQPVPALPDGVTYVSIAANEHFAVAVRSDGQAVWWPPTPWEFSIPDPPAGVAYTQVSSTVGSAINLLRSDGQITNVSALSVLPPPSPGVPYVRVAAGHSVTGAIRADGTIVTSAAANSALAQTPQPPEGTAFVDLAIGGTHGLGLLSDGNIIGWGSNLLGAATAPPLPVGMKYLAVEAGFYHSVALRSDGQVVCFGRSGDAQCNGPNQIDGIGFDAFDVRSTSNQFLGIRSDGSSVAWGYGLSSIPLPPPPPPGTRAVSLGFGQTWGATLGDDGLIHAWGSNADGQLDVPPLPKGRRYAQLAINVGVPFGVALRDDGEVVAWGSGAGGQTSVPPLPQGLQYTKVVRGASHAVALRSDGAAICWGSNGSGQCLAPLLPSGISFVDVDAFADGSSAVTNMGEIHCWGAGLSTVCAMQPALPPGDRIIAAQVRPKYAFATTLQGESLCWSTSPISSPCELPSIPEGFELGERRSSMDYSAAVLRAIVPACPSDLNADGATDGTDLSLMLGQWGPWNGAADLDFDGVVDGSDLAMLLGAWGACPSK